jgi:hypothetical protein
MERSAVKTHHEEGPLAQVEPQHRTVRAGVEDAESGMLGDALDDSGPLLREALDGTIDLGPAEPV